MYIETKVCPGCGRRDKIPASPDTHDRYLRWKAGKGLIQKLLPELSASQREQLMTGYCDPCWKKFICIPAEQDSEE